MSLLLCIGIPLSEYFPELGPVFGHTDEQQGDYVLQGEVGSIGDELFCMPRKPRSSTFILKALSELNETVRRETADTGDPEQDLFFLAYRTVARVTDLAMEESQIQRIPHHVAYTLYDFRGEIARRGQVPIVKQASFGGNFFTLVDAKKQQAIACTSTLGNSFGSLINSYRDPTIILNNLFDYASILEHNVVLLNTFVFIPMISFKNGTDAKIRFTWAGPGGSLERSLDIPRLITSVIFKIFGGTTLLNATTTPLLFPVGSSRNIHSGGIPYVR
ncbi:unnamed protein product [Nippostrongylus brasiliensis]|uniref:COesterase domain-containing protein n=1 Tax=Nippostrongylus brasiliensis TaxID=27835 RepID=A0A158R246_NIPBR|nr:unnamed protein product [Nippostrongylus brasiliensis]